MQSRCETLKYKKRFGIDNRDLVYRSRGVYHTKDTSRMETARMKQEEEVTPE